MEFEGIVALVRLLENNSTIKYLGLARCAITNDGMIILAQALKTNRTLISLDLSRNAFAERGLKALADALEENHTLTRVTLLFKHRRIYLPERPERALLERINAYVARNRQEALAAEARLTIIPPEEIVIPDSSRDNSRCSEGSELSDEESRDDYPSHLEKILRQLEAEKKAKADAAPIRDDESSESEERSSDEESDEEVSRITALPTLVKPTARTLFFVDSPPHQSADAANSDPNP